LAYFVGAYAASPNTQGWDSELETSYFQRLKGLSNIKGLEHPFVGTLHPHDDAWFLRNIDPDWHFVFTCIPGVMAALGQNPHFGIASDDPSGRAAAVAFLVKARDAIAALNKASGRCVVDAIQIHTSPKRTNASSSVSALNESLAELVEWDWQGARILIEHCDAFIPNQNAAKGFLSLEDEISAVLATNARFSSNLGIVINWGRSAIEARSAQGPLEHIKLAKERGVLAGLFFSGASGAESAYGVWADSHMPPSINAPGGLGAESSLMTETEIRNCLLASDYKTLGVLGLKIGIRPSDSTLDTRLAYLRSALDAIDAQAGAVDRQLGP
jgi:Domain of unknown function (DUF4862)